MASKREIKAARKAFMQEWSRVELKRWVEHEFELIERSLPEDRKKVMKYVKLPKSVDGMLGFLIDVGCIAANPPDYLVYG